jgi:hypothetical protein
LYYTTAGHSYSEAYKALMPQPAWDGINYQTIEMNMSNLFAGGTDWSTNTITRIRLDLGATAADDFRIEYIQIDTGVTLAAGLYQSYQLGYHNEDVNYITAPVAEGGTNSVNYPSIADNISYQWIGYFLAPTTGVYNFSLTSDDGSYFWIGSNAISGYTTGNANVFATYNTGTVVSGNISLTAGTYYPVRTLYGNGIGGAYITVSFSGPGIATRSDGTGYFFYNSATLGI